METFATLLRRFRQRANLSGNALARQIDADASYLNRVEREEREPPRRPMVVDIATALQLAPNERDELLAAAGHLPESLITLGAADPTLRLVADVLSDQTIPAAQRDDFRQLIALAARRWRPDTPIS